MKKSIIIIILLALATFTFSMPYSANTTDDNDSLQDAFLTMLDPFVSEAIIDHYGYDKSYGLFDATIIDIRRDDQGGFTFIVDVQVNTFETANNPPYGKETIRFNITPSGVDMVSFTHVGDDEEKNMLQFYKEVLIDIKQSFHLNLLPYKRYDYNQLRYKAEIQNEFNSLAAIAEEIVISVLSAGTQQPYKNVINPVTFVKGDEAYLLFKKADGTNMYYHVRMENGIWSIIEKKSGKGKKMKYELLWYM